MWFSPRQPTAVTTTGFKRLALPWLIFQHYLLLLIERWVKLGFLGAGKQQEKTSTVPQSRSSARLKVMSFTRPFSKTCDIFGGKMLWLEQNNSSHLPPQNLKISFSRKKIFRGRVGWANTYYKAKDSGMQGALPINHRFLWRFWDFLTSPFRPNWSFPRTASWAWAGWDGIQIHSRLKCLQVSPGDSSGQGQK